MLRSILVVVIVCFIFRSQLFICSVTQTLPSVAFSTNPIGAEVFVDDHSQGNTPTTVSVSPGYHMVRFSLPGFIDSVQQIKVDPKDLTSLELFIRLMPNIRLTPLPNDYIRNAVWSYRGSTIQLTTGIDKEVLKSYCLTTKSTVISSNVINTIQNIPASVNQQLSNAEDATQIGIYNSPSGHYIAYPVVHSYQTGLGVENGVFFQLFDMQAKTYIHSEAFLPNKYSLKWSPDEAWVLILSGTYTAFVNIQGDKTNVINTPRFIDEKGQTIETNYEISGPSNDGKAIMHGNTTGTLDSNWEWLVDLKTLIGRPIPFTQVFDAQFTDNNQYFYAATDQGIEQISMDLKIVTSIDDVVSARWGVKRVILSPGMKYAFIESGITEFSEYWIYQINIP